VAEADDVAELVEGDRLDVVAEERRAVGPVGPGLPEVHRLGQGVDVEHAAAGREVGVGDVARQVVVAVLVGPPADDDVGVLVQADLGERQRRRRDPRGDGSAHGGELASVGHVVGAAVERERQARMRPRTRGRERDGPEHVRHAAAGRRHAGARRPIEHTGHHQPVVCLVAGQGRRRGVVEPAAGQGRVAHVPEPPQVVLHRGERGMRLTVPQRRRRRDGR
jgi:hypothetical protein